MNQMPQQTRSMQNARSHAFTLIELLVVIGIIVLLMSLVIPTLLKVRNQAGKSRTAADFQTIAVALEAYKQDFSDIPRTDPASFDTGAAILGKALLGPYGDGMLPNAVPPPYDQADPPVFQATAAYHVGDCVRQDQSSPLQYVCFREVPAGGAPLDNNSWASFTATDGSDGPGFKARVGAAKVWGPYLQQGKIKNEGVDLLDLNGFPILYFPARLGSVNVTKVTSAGMPLPYVDSFKANGVAVQSLYNADDNIEAFRRTSELPVTDTTKSKIVLNRIQMMLGDLNCNGYIDNGETAINQPYLLWSAGVDGIYGPDNYTPDPANPTANQKAVTKCDDVTNFQ